MEFKPQKQKRVRPFTWLIEDDEPPSQPQTETFSSAANIQLDTDPTPKKIQTHPIRIRI